MARFLLLHAVSLNVACIFSVLASRLICHTKYVGSSYCRAEMYADRVAYCPLVSHGEYADADKQTDGRQTVTLRFPLDAASVKSGPCVTSAALCWPTNEQSNRSGARFTKKSYDKLRKNLG